MVSLLQSAPNPLIHVVWGQQLVANASHQMDKPQRRGNRTRSSGVSGVLNVDKPVGMTSHDVVARVRRVVGQRRVGHAGTLDPLATGVLVVCLGKATRLVEYLVEGLKVYRGTIRLGQVTETDDTEGAVIQEHETVGVSLSQIEIELAKFRGEIDQVPPIYSALKRDGRALYEYARKGVALDIPSRTVIVHRLEVVAFESPYLVVDVACAKGTYIRSLARDIGQALGCGGHLAQLQRTAVGPFTLDDAVPLNVLEAEGYDGHLIRMAQAMATQMPRVRISDKLAQIVGHGQSVALS